MRKFSALNFLDHLKPGWFFLFLFAYQLIFTFQGFDLSDEGLYATSYQQIFKNPETVQYNFMFWFSAIVGGAWHAVFPDLGLWGIRLAGVLVTTSTIIVTYNLLKTYLRPAHLKLGLLLIILLINNNLKLVHYNDLSALFNMLTIVFLFAGLRDENHWKILIAGAFVSISFFTRLPNILNLGLAFGMFYYGYFAETNFRQQVMQVFSFFGGFLLMTGAMLLFMNAIGHLPIFTNAVKLVSEMGSGGEDSYYGPIVLIKNFIRTYAATLKLTVFVVALLGLGAVILNYYKRSDYYAKWPILLIKIAVLAFLAYAIYNGTIDNFALLYFFTGISLLATAMIVITSTSPEIKVLSLFGAFILLTYPFSSSAGLFTVGIYSLWLSLPIALDYLFKINSINANLTIFRTDAADNTTTTVTRPQLHDIRRWTIVILIAGCLFYSYRYPFFDRHERTKMTATLNSPRLKWIHTTHDRASLTNELLAELGKHVEENDFLLAYQTIPLINYITNTRPYVRSAYPWLYEAEVFKKELTRSSNVNRILPLVVRQKVKFTGASSTWPSKDMYTEAWDVSNKKRDSYMYEFMASHGYTLLWANAVFEIWKPAKRVIE